MSKLLMLMGFEDRCFSTSQNKMRIIIAGLYSSSFSLMITSSSYRFRCFLFFTFKHFTSLLHQHFKKKDSLLRILLQYLLLVVSIMLRYLSIKTRPANTHNVIIRRASSHLKKAVSRGTQETQIIESSQAIDTPTKESNRYGLAFFLSHSLHGCSNHDATRGLHRQRCQQQ